MLRQHDVERPLRRTGWGITTDSRRACCARFSRSLVKNTMQKTTKLYSGSQNTGSPYDPTRSGSLRPSRPILAPASMPDPAFYRLFLALQAVRQSPLYNVCADRCCL